MFYIKKSRIYLIYYLLFYIHIIFLHNFNKILYLKFHYRLLLSFDYQTYDILDL